MSWGSRPRRLIFIPTSSFVLTPRPCPQFCCGFFSISTRPSRHQGYGVTRTPGYTPETAAMFDVRGSTWQRGLWLGITGVGASFWRFPSVEKAELFQSAGNFPQALPAWPRAPSPGLRCVRGLLLGHRLEGSRSELGKGAQLPHHISRLFPAVPLDPEGGADCSCLWNRGWGSDGNVSWRGVGWWDRDRSAFKASFRYRQSPYSSYGFQALGARVAGTLQTE